MNITLITGSANGLGESFAKLYAKDNNNLLLIDIDETNLLRVKNELSSLHPNIFIDTLVADLTKIEELKRVYQYTLDKDYFVNNLVNSAGFGDQNDFLDENNYAKSCQALLGLVSHFDQNHHHQRYYLNYLLS